MCTFNDTKEKLRFESLPQLFFLRTGFSREFFHVGPGVCFLFPSSKLFPSLPRVSFLIATSFRQQVSLSLPLYSLDTTISASKGSHTWQWKITRSLPRILPCSCTQTLLFRGPKGEVTGASLGNVVTRTSVSQTFILLILGDNAMSTFDPFVTGCIRHRWTFFLLGLKFQLQYK